MDADSDWLQDTLASDMRARPFVLITGAAATLALLSSCTCNACPTDDTKSSTDTTTGDSDAEETTTSPTGDTGGATSTGDTGP
jgi:hypothetical protein